MGKAKRSLADQLFDFEGVDRVDDGIEVFINVTLKVPVGSRPIKPEEDTLENTNEWVPEYHIGKKFSHATLDSNVSKVTFFDKLNDQEGHTYNLELKIGEKVK